MRALRPSLPLRSSPGDRCPSPPRVRRPARAGAQPPPIPDVPSRALRRELRDQPVDGHPLGVDRELAIQQWETLRQTYLDLGHEVEVIEAQAACRTWSSPPTAAWSSRGARSAPASPTRSGAPEAPAYLSRLADVGLKDVTEPVHVNEGEGDFLVVGDLVLAGTGFRTDPGAHTEAQELFGVPVISLQLVDPRFYHLDTALAVLDDRRSPTTRTPSARQPRCPAASCSPTRSSPPRPTPSSSGSTPCPTAATWCADRRGRLWPRSCASAATCRSGSTSVSCSRPVAASVLHHGDPRLTHSAR